MQTGARFPQKRANLCAYMSGGAFAEAVKLPNASDKKALPDESSAFLELLTGFEPVTPSLPRTCSTC